MYYTSSFRQDADLTQGVAKEIVLTDHSRYPTLWMHAGGTSSITAYLSRTSRGVNIASALSLSLAMLLVFLAVHVSCPQGSHYFVNTSRCEGFQRSHRAGPCIQAHPKLPGAGIGPTCLVWLEYMQSVHGCCEEQLAVNT